MSKAVIHLAWADFDEAVNRIAEMIPDAKESRGVFGVPRGGLCLGVALSHRLGVPYLLEPEDGMILVDDIQDSGLTLELLLAIWRPHCSVTWVKRDSAPLNVMAPTVIHGDAWIVFPWENPINATQEAETYAAARE